ncbi:TRAP transporter small permease [Lysinibacillus sp. LZ02]|uniref:TRAP transporter small permease n=1 Tax=Lysinibacillus sp. LZ02 TaxID=3420668 RepID=UPI003D36AE0A
MKGLYKTTHIGREVCKYISCFGVFTMMLLITADVFMRNVFGIPVPGVYEITENFLMPLVVFPALGYTYWVGILPRLTELVSKAPRKFQLVHHYLLLVLDTVVFALLTYYGFQFALSGLNIGMAIPVAGKLVPIWPFYFLVPLGFFLVLIEVLMRFVKKEGDVISHNVGGDEHV